MPKVPNPVTIKEFRHIAYFSMIYKLIAKVLSLKILRVIESAILESQDGFIPGRKEVDNIIIAHKIVKAYSRKNLPPRYMIKVDI